MEKKIEEIAIAEGIEARNALSSVVTILRHRNILSTIIEDKVLKVINICNRGIHGEVVNEEYIDYIKIVMVEITTEFGVAEGRKNTGNEGFVVCNRCGYTGSSEYSNHCPKCHFTSDDY